VEHKKEKKACLKRLERLGGTSATAGVLEDDVESLEIDAENSAMFPGRARQASSICPREGKEQIVGVLKNISRQTMALGRGSVAYPLGDRRSKAPQ